MKLSPKCLKRYKDLAFLYLKYGQPGMFSTFRFQDGIRGPRPGESDARQLPRDLERLGPTFVKLGQLLSSRADLLPAEARMGLSRLQDNVKPFPYADVELTVERELGMRIADVFAFFEKEPVAAASLGQVHSAALRDGRPVVVKVQRPNIRQQLDEDFIALTEVAKMVHRHSRLGQRYQVLRLVEEFETILLQETDYRQEAANMVALAKNLEEFPHLQIPLPVESCSTSRVLTMQRIEGTKLTELNPLAKLNIDGKELAEEAFHAYLKQVLVDGLFHADPHAGNVFLTAEGNLGLLDLGMVGRLTPSMRENLLKLLLAVSEGEGDQAATIAIAISDPGDEFDELDFRHDIGQAVARQQNSNLSEMDIGRTILKVSRCAAESGLRTPLELALLGKTLFQLDEIGRILDRRFEPNESVRRHTSHIMHQHMKTLFSERKLYSGLLEARQFFGKLPMRAGRILDALGRAELRVKVPPAETRLFMESFQKIANRITAGLVFAALIIGAALLMRVQTQFQLFGYPGLAIVCFLGAAGGGLWLVLNTLWQDYKTKRRLGK